MIHIVWMGTLLTKCVRWWQPAFHVGGNKRGASHGEKMNEIRALRHKLGLNLTDFAKLIGTHRVTISAWEHDYHKVSKAYKARIREKTGYDLDKIQEAGEEDEVT